MHCPNWLNPNKAVINVNGSLRLLRKLKGSAEPQAECRMGQPTTRGSQTWVFSSKQLRRIDNYIDFSCFAPSFCWSGYFGAMGGAPFSSSLEVYVRGPQL
jgi:hypothetical protein